MIAVVFYDPASGDILQAGQMPRASAEADGRAFLVIEQYAADLDRTHRVQDGKLVALAGAA